MTPQATATTHPDPDNEALAADDDDTPFVHTTTLISDSEILSEKPTPSHTRTGEVRNYFLATWPFAFHFVTVLTLIAILRTYIDGHHFNLEDWSTLSGFTPLQSDITTAISAGVAIYRLFVTLWTGALLWRCIFILLGDHSGISLEQVARLLTWQTYIPSRLLSLQALVAVILLAAFLSQLSGPILTGSITWASSYRLFESPECVTDIEGFSNRSQRGPQTSLDNTLTSAFASTAWLNSLEDGQTMKRVIESIAHLPINSTLKNVTLPYFAISKLEWIRDPITEIPQTMASFYNGSGNPFTKYSAGHFALVPGDGVDPEFSVISETRIIVGIFSVAGPPKRPSAYTTRAPYPRAPLPPSPCATSSLFGDLPSNIGFVFSNNSCLIYGRVTYVAGAAECWDCRISSRVTVQNDTVLTVTPSVQTRVAIGMMPMVGGMMVLQNNSLPRAYNNLNRYATELLLRSYAASWTHIGKSTNTLSLSTDVQIAIPTSRAKVMWWRVWVWFSLNLLFTLSGFLFLVVQKLSGQKLIRDPQLAALLLDTSEVLHKRDRAFCDFSTLTKDDKGLGNLRFVRNWDQGGHRQVGFVDD